MPISKLTLALQRATGFEHLGYGTFGQNLEKGLSYIGVDTKVPPSIDSYSVPPKGYGAVLWASQPGHAYGKWKGQFSVCYTMWESTVLPEGFSSTLHNFDMVIVPNESNLELVSEFNSNTFKVPLGYDSTTWTYQNPKPPDECFTFLLCAAGAAEKARKGSDLACRAFEAAFPNWESMDPSPRILVKCLKHPPDPKPYLTAKTGKIGLWELRNLYSQCQAMVLPSRGEGWGYHPQQAVATGLPAILSDIPGHREYCWVPGFSVVPTTVRKAAPFLQGDGGDWWEPDVNVLAERMKDMYENWEKWVELAKEGSYELSSRYSHIHMAQHTANLIGADHLTTLDTGSWQAFTEREYLTTVNRSLNERECTIGDRSYNLVPNEDYWLPANARLILKSAGYCANPDSHLSRVVE